MSTVKGESWLLFDRIVVDAAAGSGFRNPWRRQAETLHYEPDYATLQRLLGVPLLLGANSQSGVPALALDVWVAYELRRAGFDPDAVWPRASVPRVLPTSLAALLASSSREERDALHAKFRSGKTLGGAVGSAAKILGKNYVKQVDVVLSDWSTGPEILISTKRMDSSFGKNAANRVEESYGDARNLRARHPQCALGFVYSLRSTALTREPDKAAWLVDLLTKLGREDDAYDAVALVIPDYVSVGVGSDEDDGENRLVEAGLEPGDEEADLLLPFSIEDRLTERLRSLPAVELRHDDVPPPLDPARFFAAMIARVLDNCPVNFHIQARRLREQA